MLELCNKAFAGWEKWRMALGCVELIEPEY